MPRFAANISTLFTERPMLERFAAARQAGFEAVEMQFPYGEDVEALATAKARAGVEVVLINLPAGDWAAGERGVAALPGREAEFREAVILAERYAGALGCRQVNALAGIRPAGAEPERCFATLAGNLAYAARAMAPGGIRVVTEAINTVDVAGFCLPTVAEAVRAVSAAGAENAAVQFDVYHVAMMGEDVVERLTAAMPHIGHIQFADCPGRREPGSGAIDFDGLFDAIDHAGYTGFVGAEYFPDRPTAETLGWFAAARG